ncbi:MAG: hypothetical protein AVDCRST_MAG77-5557 [uncultured Chloroflexi bacterium]|uniref:BD-FAE-like domain-containing protein n=1 Tax=uncultured Chloroflexota bacterium TaxID=166587 RepID=A0A6J4KA40_9CHLR|nr:MAG: hypothetical protein AVDCRST_MAG77-5557 [uncultured Chloroflexota bacterium]
MNSPESAPLWPSEQQPGGVNQAGLPRLTPYLIDPPQAAGKPRAAVVVCPGGGYRARAAHEGEPVARWLNTLGLHAFVLDYRVATERPDDAPALHPLPLQDAQRALRTVRHGARDGRWTVDPARVGILGFSAGGHLAATLATHFDAGDPTSTDPVERESCRPDAAILCYAVISFLQYPHLGSARNLLGENPALDQRRALSNELCVTAETPPTFLWHTAEDPGVPVENSLLFAGALARHSVPFALHVFPKGRHGLGLAPADPTVHQWTDLCARWLADTSFVEAT